MATLRVLSGLPSNVAVAFEADREHFFQIAVRAWNHVYGDQLANALRRSGASIGCGFARRHVATYHGRTQATANLLHADQLHACGFTIASEASISATRPRVSIIPNASIVFSSH